MSQPEVLEGTWEEIKLHDEELSGKRFRLIPLPSEVKQAPSKASKPGKYRDKEHRPATPRKLTGMGKFAGILPSSEEFIRQKQEEIELEERKFRR